MSQGRTVYVSAWSAWSPGLTSREDWAAWARGERELSATEEAPKLEFAPPLFRRRLSQLTRMTVQAGHEALAGRKPMKLSFASEYGEIGQQYAITERLIESGEVSPAQFSLSVFNTPVAALSIVEGNAEGYVACYPGTACFSLGFIEAAAAVLSGAEEERLFVVADEFLPPAYAPLREGPNVPYALALVLSAAEGPGGVPVTVGPEGHLMRREPGESAASAYSPVQGDSGIPEALAFLKAVLLPAMGGGSDGGKDGQSL